MWILRATDKIHAQGTNLTFKIAETICHSLLSQNNVFKVQVKIWIPDGINFLHVMSPQGSFYYTNLYPRKMKLHLKVIFSSIVRVSRTFIVQVSRTFQQAALLLSLRGNPRSGGTKITNDIFSGNGFG